MGKNQAQKDPQMSKALYILTQPVDRKSGHSTP
jgi:hypothetical protein